MLARLYADKTVGNNQVNGWQVSPGKNHEVDVSYENDLFSGN